MWRVLCAVVAIGAVSPPEESWVPASEGGFDGTLLQVHVLFRHGHRVPKAPYPTDPNSNATLWDDGLGQLTEEGRRQGYGLGIGLRKRYGRLLPSVRAWKDIKTQSSQVARTIMTAQTVLAGLIPPRESDCWSELNWQPAPVISRAPELDNKLAASPPCPKLKRLLAEPDHPSREIKELRAYLEEHSGRKIHTLNAVANLYTCMDIERQAGLNLPNWTTNVFPEPMKTEAGKALGRSSSTLESARLRAGPLLEELTTFDVNKIGEPIRLYATHDSVLAGLLGAVGLFSGKPPGFVSTVALEYRLGEDDDVHVQIWWREAAGTRLQRLEWPGCGERCPLDQLKIILSSIIPKDWEKECKLPRTWYLDGERSSVPLGWWIALGFALSCSLLLLVVIADISAKRGEYEVLIPANRRFRWWR